ncbi:MAG TPA: hypothetical protein VHT73_10800 [Thermodesulfobacteriota bacterium]|nr:hypothetical protein [Thermodesulfobacteriota bacterium]
MTNYSKIILFVFSIIFIIGCAKPQGATKQEKRDFIEKMKDDSLSELYNKKPEARYLVKNAAGYGVFSNVSTLLLFLGGGSGYGVVADNATGKKTYMNMALADIGLGVGIKDFRAVFIFNNRDVMNTFIYSGWEFGAEADAALKSEEKGAAGSGAASVKQDIIVYQITDAGIALKAGLRGMKFWRNNELNY